LAAARVAVVGAGLAGLSAALELVEAGCEVELLEKSRLLGGRATSFTVAGHEVDNGQHVFLACCDAFIAFVRRVGMDDVLHIEERFDVVAIRRGVRARLRAESLPAPWHLAASFLRYRHLAFRSRIAVARALAAVGSARSAEGSFAAWLARERQPADAIAAFWEPFVVPALNAPLERVSAADAAFVIETAFLRDARAARFGWSTVPLAHIAAAAAKRVNALRLSDAVTGIERNGAIGLRLLSGERLAYDAVVLALPPSALARILGSPAHFGLHDLDAFEPFPIVDVHLWHDGEDIDVAFAALLESPVQWIFRKGEGYLCCSASAAGPMVTESTDAVVAKCWDEVRGAFPALRAANLVASAVTRNPASTYLPRAGVKAPGPRTSDSRVTIAGSWTATGWPDTMESAVRSGSNAARALLETLRPAPAVPAER
jgi:squalene-associated FAD-dependent desaturase